MTIQLSLIEFDAGTQVRATVNQSVVDEFAEQMMAGAVFPSVVVFHDGGHRYLADGFHRCLAAKKIGLLEVPADIHLGTKSDALWWALGANKNNGERMTRVDKQHAAGLALAQWPEKSQKEIALQVGCSQSLVSKTVERTRKNTGGQTGIRGRALVMQNKVARARELLVAGVTSNNVRKQLGLNTEAIAILRRELNAAPRFKRTSAAVAQRRQQIKTMVGQGHGLSEIESQTGLHKRTIQYEIHRAGLRVPNPRAAKHDSNRIVDQMVMDAEHLTADSGLINFGELDKSKVSGWISSLAGSRQLLNAFIRRLTEQQVPINGEVNF